MKKSIIISISAAVLLTLVPSFLFIPSASADNRPDVESVAREIGERNNYGRLVINELGIDVAVFSSEDSSEFQQISDAEDSACMFDWTDGNQIVTDHNYQEFGALANREAEAMELITGEEVQNFRCIERIEDGRNLGKYLAYENGEAIGNKGENTMVLYTCKNDGSDGAVVITVWERC